MTRWAIFATFWLSASAAYGETWVCEAKQRSAHSTVPQRVEITLDALGRSARVSDPVILRATGRAIPAQLRRDGANRWQLQRELTGISHRDNAEFYHSANVRYNLRLNTARAGFTLRTIVYEFGQTGFASGACVRSG